jgi:beta-galactosidase
MKHLLFLALLFALSTTSFSQVSFGKAEKINNQWQFNLGNIKDAEKVDFNAEKWRTLDLPHDWTIEETLSPDLASCTGYLPGGLGWYRKSILIPADKKGEKIFVYFEGVYNRSEVFINGVSIGKRPNGYISFMYDITPFIKYGQENVLAVKVDHTLSADSRWYTGSGIYRDVYLVYANAVHIDKWGVFYQSTKCTKDAASLQVQVDVKNETISTAKLQVSMQLFSAENKLITQQVQEINAKAEDVTRALSDLSVSNPQLWTLKTPYLYKLKTQILQNGKLMDESIQNVGIRNLQFDANKGFALNGEWMKVKGVCIHHEAGCLGSVVPKKVWERRLKNLKALGANAIRLSHNPQAPDVYDVCDEIGLLVLDEAFDEWEFAKKKWLKGWNKGTPGFQGSAPFFKEWSDRDAQDMVLRDRNHPSIIMWSIGNEVDYPNDPYSHPVLDGSQFNQPVSGGYLPNNPKAERLGNIAKRLVADVKKLDTSRPVTAALAGVVMSNETEYPGVLDLTGYNYTEDRYEMDHQKYPHRVIYGSETGHSMDAWKSVRDKDFIFGQFLWTGIDYLGESGAWPARGSTSGLLDLAGFQKPRGYFRQALWDEKPVIYIGTYPASHGRRGLSMDAWSIWNYKEGAQIRVVCYTNCQKAQLNLNGKQVGEMKDYDDNTGIISWDIPYQPGQLEVVGLNKQTEVCRYKIQTSARPFAITAISDFTILDKNKDLAHIVLQVVDENGWPVMLSDDEITCKIEGPAKLLGIEASDNTDMGDYRDPVQRAYHGRALAYIQTTGAVGRVKLTFSAPGLKDAVVKLEVR